MQLITSVFLVLLFVTNYAIAADREHGSHIVLFGNLHAHSELSDDVNVNDGSMLPGIAYQSAMNVGLDFIAITDHHKANNSPGKLFQMKPEEYKSMLFDVAMNFNTENEGKFVAIPGIEWGNTATGNHINIFGAPILPPASILDKDYKNILVWAAENAEFTQFNHPKSWEWKSNRNKKVGNFGEALYASTKEFVTTANQISKTFTVIASVHGGHLSGKHRHSTEKTHRDIHRDHFNLYKEYLDKGLRISPSANQDTHHTNWGSVTAARTAVWAKNVSYDAVMEGFKARRVYVTEDDELAFVVQVIRKGRTYWMGESIPDIENETDIEIIVKAWQVKGSDDDAQTEGPYSFTIFYDPDGIGGGGISQYTTVKGLKGNVEHNIPFTISPNTYLFVQVTEENGKDNPVGDGEDEFKNESGDNGSDGKRDNMNDSAWASPIWFDSASLDVIFVWSTKSSLYHDKNCWAVKRIGQANYRENNTPPSNKTKHNCKADRTDGE